VARYEGDREITVLSGYGNPSDDPPAGSRLPLDGPSVTATVLRTGRPVRMDGAPEDPGTLASIARAHDVSCTVAAPIVVEGSLWGLVVSSWHGDEHPAPGVEEQLAAFTPLIATAISNVQARDSLRQLAEEQGALRRVATLVAQGAPPSAIFGAVASEASGLLGIDRIDIDRYRPDGKVVMLGSAGEVPVPFGEPWRAEPSSVVATVRDTGRPSRIDDFSDLPGLSAQTARAIGISSVAGVPIVVDGAIWGVMLALAPERLPADIERRLTDFTDLVASAISQAQARDDLITSRARIVSASDETRRRIERNLHDGVQQRMLALGLSLRAVRTSIPDSETDARRGLDRVDG
jgi:GAF domain-containing protein